MGSNSKDEILDYVQCSGNETSLRHCREAQEGEGMVPFPCSPLAYVVCAGKHFALFTHRPHAMNQTKNFLIWGWTLIKPLKHFLS